MEYEINNTHLRKPSEILDKICLKILNFGNIDSIDIK